MVDTAVGVEVFLRIRPTKKPSGYLSQDDIDENQIFFDVPKTEGTIVNNSRTRYGFHFNGFIDEKATQDDVFRLIGSPAIKNVLEGFNSTVFAYGQTGSGKTFTITGGPERYADRGIIPRAISLIFAEFQARQKNMSYKCYVSYLELYNEVGYDLLGENKTEFTQIEEMPKVTMLEDEDGNYHFRNLTVHQIGSEEDALNLLFLGDTNRAIGETEMNQSSSRSHCIFTLMVEGRNTGSDTVIRSKLNIVDLAGSERVHKTNSTGKTLKEAQHINQSLFYLEMVIVALHERSKKSKENIHVPYRNSMMTSVLRDSLGGNCKTIMIATISLEANQTDEAISTCHFAQRVALIKNNAFVNEELEPELVIKRLKVEVKRLQEEVRFLKGENGEGDGLSNEEREEVEKAVKEYVAGDEEVELNIGNMTLTKIQVAYSIFKKLLVHAEDNGTDVDKVDHSGGNTCNLEEEIKKMKKTLQQKTDDIRTLVEIVQKGRTDFSVDKLNEMTNGHTVDNSEDTYEGHTQLENKENIHRSVQVCRVERCLDSSIINEPAIAFSWFQKRYPGVKAIEDNKCLLQSRCQEAKEAGHIVKKARDNINLHKDKIEKFRLETAIQGVHVEVTEETIDNRETSYRLAIEREKSIYKEALDKLRELKGIIEHVRRLLEKNRTKMQKDFDAWYRDMCEIRSLSNQPRTELNKENSNMIQANSRAQRTDIPDDKKIDYISESSLTQNQVHLGTASPTFELPQGARLTGNKEADEDIIAFYKAKEALLKRSQQR